MGATHCTHLKTVKMKSFRCAAAGRDHWNLFSLKVNCSCLITNQRHTDTQTLASLTLGTLEHFMELFTNRSEAAGVAPTLEHTHHQLVIRSQRSVGPKSAMFYESRQLLVETCPCGSVISYCAARQHLSTFGPFRQ